MTWLFSFSHLSCWSAHLRCAVLLSLRARPSLCPIGVSGHQLRPAQQPRAVHPPYRPLGPLRSQGRGHQLRQERRHQVRAALCNDLSRLCNDPSAQQFRGLAMVIRCRAIGQGIVHALPVTPRPEGPNRACCSCLPIRMVFVVSTTAYCMLTAESVSAHRLGKHSR